MQTPQAPDLIVVGLDGSQESVRAFGWAVTEAAARGGRVRAVHAVDAPSVPVDTERANGPPSYSIDELEEAATRYLARFATWGRSVGVDVETLVVRDPRPANALTRLSFGAALLVLGAHGLTGVRGFVVGSVSKQCTRRSACPVVVLPPQVEPGDSAEQIVPDLASRTD